MPRVDDRKVLSGIIHVIEKDLRWVDAPSAYVRSTQNLYNRFRRWSENGVFELIFTELSRSHSKHTELLMIDATYPGTPYEFQPEQGDQNHGCLANTKGGMNSKLHVLCDRKGCPVRLHLSEGE